MAPETFTEARASATQATRKGWPRKRSLKPVPGHPQGVAPETFTEARASATQATRKGWPYYIRPLHQRHDRFVYSRASPCGWPARGGLQVTPLGPPLAGGLLQWPDASDWRVALLYTGCFVQSGVESSIVGPPLAGGLPGAARSERFWGHPLRVACLGRPEVNASGATPCGWPAWGGPTRVTGGWPAAMARSVTRGRRAGRRTWAGAGCAVP